jgi:predicted ATPase
LAYREKGYNLIEVPRVSVEERVAFIEAHLWVNKRHLRY